MVYRLSKDVGFNIDALINKKDYRHTVLNRRKAFNRTSVDSQLDSDDIFTQESEMTTSFNIYDENKVFKWIDNALKFFDDRLVKPIEDKLKSADTTVMRQSSYQSLKKTREIMDPYSNNKTQNFKSLSDMK